MPSIIWPSHQWFGQKWRQAMMERWFCDEHGDENLYPSWGGGVINIYIGGHREVVQTWETYLKNFPTSERKWAKRLPYAEGRTPRLKGKRRYMILDEIKCVLDSEVVSLVFNVFGANDDDDDDDRLESHWCNVLLYDHQFCLSLSNLQWFVSLWLETVCVGNHQRARARMRKLGLVV